MHIVQVSVITPVLSHKIPEHSRKKRKEKSHYCYYYLITYCASLCYTFAFAGLLIVNVPIMHVRSLDCLLCEYPLYL